MSAPSVGSENLHVHLRFDGEGPQVILDSAANIPAWLRQRFADRLATFASMTLFPDGVTWDGRDEVACEFLKRKYDFGDVRTVAVAANRQPALAVYRRGSDDAEYRAWAIVLLGVLDGKLREIATFASPELFVRFDLPPTLPERRPLAP